MAKTSLKRWSQDVTEHSDALDLEKGVFAFKDPKKIALSLKRSAERSNRRKSDPYRSAMSMLNSTSTAPASIFRTLTAAGWRKPRTSCAGFSTASA
jgi:hypothetical protein